MIPSCKTVSSSSCVVNPGPWDPMTRYLSLVADFFARDFMDVLLLVVFACLLQDA
jgi:hypothetical protein